MLIIVNKILLLKHTVEHDSEDHPLLSQDHAATVTMLYAFPALTQDQKKDLSDCVHWIVAVSKGILDTDEAIGNIDKHVPPPWHQEQALLLPTSADCVNPCNGR